MGLSGGGGGASPATTVTGPDAYGAAAVVGVGMAYARNDHDHGLPAAPAASLAYQQTSLSVDTTIATTITALLAIALTAGTWLISATVTIVGAGSNQQVSIRLKNTTDVTIIDGSNNLITANAWQQVVLTPYVIVLAGAKTITLEGISATVGVTGKVTNQNADSPATYLTAVKIA